MSAPQGLWNADWLNANSQRRYPLHEGVDPWDTAHSFRIPDDFIVDVIWPVHPDPSIDPKKFHILSISIFGNGIVVTLGYDGDPIGSATIPVVGFVPNSSYMIAGAGICFDSIGKIVIGTLDSVLASAGSYVFNVNDTALETTTVKPMLRNLAALYVQNGDELSDPLQNDVILAAGRNAQFRIVRGEGGEPDTVFWDAVNGANLNKDCICAENPDTPCIKTINGVGPDNTGNLDLLEDDCLKVIPQPAANAIQLQDDCCKPCCGCEELNVVQTTLSEVHSQINLLANLASQLEGHVGQLQAAAALAQANGLTNIAINPGAYFKT